ncbi:MAG: hypothetical protein ACOZF0_20475 [Thermodesulfobacteriota bacterium]
MQRSLQHRARMGVLLFMVIGAMACAGKRDLYVYYQLPQPNAGMKGTIVGVEFEDKRPVKQFLTKEALEEFYTFSGKFSFSVTQGEVTETTGILDLPRVMTLTMTKRLENEGMTVLPNPAPENPVVRLVLQDFQLHYVDRRWKVRLAYEAQLLAGGEVRNRQVIKGSAERAQIIGTGDADKVVSELYNDMINQLNVAKLFANSGGDFQ